MAKRSKSKPSVGAAVERAPQRPQRFFWPGLVGVVFLANGAIMALEIVAGPLAARYLGSSLYTWTTIIGVILGGMAVGNYLGGRLSDRFAPARLLGVLFLLSAAGCVSILGLNHALGELSMFHGSPWPLRILAHLGLTLFGPALLLGTVNPVAARWSLGKGKPEGRAVGIVYASSAAGSILGTFLAGYWLVLVLGLSQIVVAIACVLLVLGVVILLAGRSRAIPTDAPSSPQEAAADSQRPTWLVWLAPNATVFLSNAAFMTVELAASRMATRVLGHSLHTWTTLLGVVLAGITLGNYIGGRLADRFASKRLLTGLLSLSAVICLTIPAINEQLSFGDTLTELSWRGRTFWHVVLAFFLPCVALGTIGPASAKFALDTRPSRGKALGNVYAWGALGSVVATFATGYILIDKLWPLSTLCALAAVLALAGSLYGARNYLSHLITGFCVVALVLSFASTGPLNKVARFFHLTEPDLPGLIYQDHSQYAWVGITDDPEYPGHRRMILDSLNHSEIILDYPDQLMFHFWYVYDAVINHLYPEHAPLKSLTIGGGGYVFPHYLERTRPGSEVQVAEIDPAVTKAAWAEFGVPDDSAMQVFDMDGRNHVADLRRQQKALGDSFEPFDVIIGDSINQFSVPFQLTTLEFNRDIHALLGPEGIYLLNTTDRYDSGRFLGAVINTCRQVFSNVYAFSCRPRDAGQHDSFVVVCAKHPLDLTSLPGIIRSKYPFYMGDLLRPDELDTLVERAGGRILTDNHAPVDNLVADVEKTQRTSGFEATEQRARRELAEAEARASAGDYEAAQPLFEAVVNRYPTNPQLRTALGVNLTRLGRLEEGMAQFSKALEYAPRFAPAHNALGAVLFEAGRIDEARKRFEEALQCNPSFVDAQANLARLLGSVGQFEEAADAFTKALALKPGDPSLHLGLAQTLRRAGDFEEAAVAARAALDRDPGLTAARFLLGQIRAQQGQFAEAVAPLEQVIAEEPSHVMAHFVLGGVYYKLGRKEDAAEQYLEASRLQPAYEDAAYNAGVTLRQLGRFEEAIPILEAVLERNPANQRAARELEKARAGVAE